MLRLTFLGRACVLLLERLALLAHLLDDREQRRRKGLIARSRA